MAQGLVGAWAFPGGYGQDLVGSNHTTGILGSPIYDGALGLGTISTNTGLWCTASDQLKFLSATNPSPFTVIWSGYNLSSPASNAAIFGVSFKWNGTGSTAPYWGYVLTNNASTN